MQGPAAPRASRRLALMAAAGALSGCSTVEGWFFPPRVKLPGERDAVLAGETLLQPDDGMEAEQVMLPPPDPRPDWPQAGGGPAHLQEHPAAGERLAVAWTANLGSGSSARQRILALPVLADGVVYAMDAYSQISAFDAATGRRRWRADGRPEEDRDGGIGGGLAVEGPLLVAVNGWGEVLGMEAASGTIQWRRRLPAPARGGPAVFEGRAFVPTVEGQLTATSIADGTSVWTWRGAETSTGLLGIPAPAADAASVIAAFPTGELAAVRPDNGRVLWVESLAATGGLAPLSEIASVRAAPIIAGGRVIAISSGGLFVSLDQRSGRRVWEREIAGVETPWVAGDWIFVVTTNQVLAAVARRDGRVKWVRQLDAFEDPVKLRDPIRWSGPALAGDRLIVASSLGRALAVSPYSGEVMGALRLPGKVSVGMVVAEQTLFMVTDSATLVALR
ncbi:MAG: PQQ-binding-like beta-propeller repeat protein [Acetobacteraceae bacterium]|nr:PQQ-binding-like beta-propeller repeat protein [Acetobacteraceae bacterium]